MDTWRDRLISVLIEVNVYEVLPGPGVYLCAAEGAVK